MSTPGMNIRVTSNTASVSVSGTASVSNCTDNVWYLLYLACRADSTSGQGPAGLYPSIGLMPVLIRDSPNNTLAKAIGAKLDKQGCIITDKRQRTNLPRVYAAGDVTGGVRQIVVACAEGAIAALSAYEDLSM